MPKLSEIYGGNYMKAEDIAGREVNVVIEEVSIMKDKDDKKKAVLHFKGKDKTLPVNVTNANMIEELLGTDDTDDWVGQRICLYTTKVDFQGKRVLAIRIKEAKGASKPAPEPEPDPVEELTDDDIPF
jgi:hypothetical protein